MKSVTFAEYVLLRLKYATFSDMVNALALLCILLLWIQVIELGLRAMILAGALFAICKAVLAALEMFRGK